jgi:hypothetical protein
MVAHADMRLGLAFALGLSLLPLGCQPMPSSWDELVTMIPEDPNQMAVLISQYRAFIGARDPVPPPELEYVLQNADSFSGSFATLSEVLQGAPPEDLNDLVGCWGNIFVAPPDELPGTFATFYRFDANHGRYESWGLLTFFGVYPIQFHDSGAFRIVDKDHFEMITEESWTSNDLTGAMEPDPVDERQIYTPYAVLVQGRLGLYVGDDPDGTGEEAPFEVYRRFECP